MRTLAVLPSRFAATRFPGKPLAFIAGRPMIQWVWEAARSAPGVDEVVVATDDERILRAVHDFDGRVVLTHPDLPSGTDRVAAALDQLDETYDLVVNIQGDEPAMHPETVAAVVQLMAEHPEFDLGTASCGFTDARELFSPNAVKVVTDDRGRALYFSRAPIPYLRHGAIFEQDFRPWMEPRHLASYQRHLGIYAFRVEALRRFTQLPPHPLERMEMLEQLRALGHGFSIGVARSPHLSLGVDVPEDVEPVTELLRAQGRL